MLLGLVWEYKTNQYSVFLSFCVELDGKIYLKKKKDLRNDLEEGEWISCFDFFLFISIGRHPKILEEWHLVS